MSVSPLGLNSSDSATPQPQQKLRMQTGSGTVSSFFKNLNVMRSEFMGVDLIFRSSDGVSAHAHKVVVAAYGIPFLRKLGDTLYCSLTCSAVTLRALVDLMYNLEVELTVREAEDALVQARTMQLNTLVTLLETTLATIPPGPDDMPDQLDSSRIFLKASSRKNSASSSTSIDLDRDVDYLTVQMDADSGRDDKLRRYSLNGPDVMSASRRKMRHRASCTAERLFAPHTFSNSPQSTSPVSHITSQAHGLSLQQQNAVAALSQFPPFDSSSGKVYRVRNEQRRGSDPYPSWHSTSSSIHPSFHLIPTFSNQINLFNTLSSLSSPGNSAFSNPAAVKSRRTSAVSDQFSKMHVGDPNVSSEGNTNTAASSLENKFLSVPSDHLDETMKSSPLKKRLRRSLSDDREKDSRSESNDSFVVGDEEPDSFICRPSITLSIPSISPTLVTNGVNGSASSLTLSDLSIVSTSPRLSQKLQIIKEKNQNLPLASDSFGDRGRTRLSHKLQKIMQDAEESDRKFNALMDSRAKLSESEKGTSPSINST